jgi:inner membrane protein
MRAFNRREPFMRAWVMVKVAAVLALMLGLAVVLARIGWLVDERQGWQREAVASVQRSSAGAQTLLGPVIQRACTEETDRIVGEGKDRRTETERRGFVLSATPALLSVQGKLRGEARYRGLYEVNGYGGSFTLDASWPTLAALEPPVRPGSRVACEPPRAWVAVSDPRGLRKAELRAGTLALAIEPGAGVAAARAGLSARLPQLADAAALANPLALHLTLELSGTESLALVPAAAATEWTLLGDWPHPSFGGRFLPVQRTVRGDGFDARWAVSALATDAPRAWQGDARLCAPGAAPSDSPYGEARAEAAAQQAACIDTLAVSFIDPVNPLVLSDRAIKYGMLFVVLSFAAVGLTELLAGRRVHPIQYGLVGLALSLFFLLLLSLSEHWPFAAAYTVASAACVAVLAMYARHMLGSVRSGAAFGAGVAALYGLLYVLLMREQSALAIGSVGLFAALAAVMWLTRRIDWYAPLPSLASKGANRL